MINLLLRLTRILSAIKNVQIPVFECHETDVRLNKLPPNHPWTSFTAIRPALKFSGWSLAHAIMKTDYLDQRNSEAATLGVLLQLDQSLDFKNGALHLQPGGAAALNDVTRTSLTGRIGHGIGILFAHSIGYKFSAHLRTELEAQGIAVHGPTGKLLPIADFICAGNNGQRAIFETKSTFSITNNIPKDVKSELRKAVIEQIDPWLKKIYPPVTESFAVRSCLREPSQGDPTAIAFVDPAGNGSPDAAKIPSEHIRLKNYAGWLRAMGLTNWAEALIARDGQQVASRFFGVFEIEGHEFAFKYVRKPYPYLHSLPLLGIELKALKAIRSALDGDSGALFAYEFNQADRSQQTFDNDVSFSIFPDGTFFGVLWPSVKYRAYIEL